MIESREFQKVKQRLLFSLTNFGKPLIYVSTATTATAANCCSGTSTTASI